MRSGIQVSPGMRRRRLTRPSCCDPMSCGSPITNRREIARAWLCRFRQPPGLLGDGALCPAGQSFGAEANPSASADRAGAF